MFPKLMQLMQLQKIDMKIDELTRNLERIPAEKKKYDETLKEKEEIFKKIMDENNDMKLQKRKIEKDILSLEEIKDKYLKQQMNVKTNKEYSALKIEMKATSQKISDLETELLTLLEKEDEFNENISEKKKELQKFNVEIENKKSELDKEAEIFLRELEQFRAEKAEKVKEIDITTYKKYDWIRINKNGIAVVPVVRDACYGCFSAVPPQKKNEIQLKDIMIFCEHCGRILVLEEVLGKANNNELLKEKH